MRCTVKSGDRTRIPIERLAVTGNKNESFVGNGIEKEVEESIVETKGSYVCSRIKVYTSTAH